MSWCLDLPCPDNRVSPPLWPVPRAWEHAAGRTQLVYNGSTYWGRKPRRGAPGDSCPLTGLPPQAALAPWSTGPPKDMKLLENSSFEAVNSQLTVETGDAHIIGR